MLNRPPIIYDAPYGHSIIGAVEIGNGVQMLVALIKDTPEDAGKPYEKELMLQDKSVQPVLGIVIEDEKQADSWISVLQKIRQRLMDYKDEGAQSDKC